MDANFVNFFLEATFYVFETTASTTVKARKPYRKRDKIAKGDITCIIALTGDFKGTVSISFAEACILSIVSKMFGEEMTDLNDEIKDAVGELANMISGQATTKFTETGNTVNAELSTVMMGPDHELDHLPDQPIIAMPYTTDSGEFTVEVCFEK